MANETRTALDALEILMQDHRELESLFSEFEYLHRLGEDTSIIVKAACAEIRTHDTLENEIFYPAVSDTAGDEAMDARLDDAEDEHDDVLDLIEGLELVRDDDAARNAGFKVIADAVREHILAEEATLFPAVKDLDLRAAAAAMNTRRAELLAESEPARIVKQNV